MENSDQLHLSLIQTDLFWEDKKSNLEMFSRKISKLDKTDIIVLPEMFTTGFTNNTIALAETMDGKTHLWMKDQAEKKTASICGSIIIKEDDKFFNRFLWVQADGVTFHYDKKHLFAMAGEDDHFSSGTEKSIINYRGWKINLQVCYDLRFPVWSRRKEDEENDYDLLIYVASWPITRVHAWSTLLKARAIENMSYCVGVNRVGTDGKGFEYSGASVVLNYLGEELSATSPSKEETITCVLNYSNLTKVRGKLPFHKDQDQFKLLK